MLFKQTCLSLYTHFVFTLYSLYLVLQSMIAQRLTFRDKRDSLVLARHLMVTFPDNRNIYTCTYTYYLVNMELTYNNFVTVAL